ncbi:MAG: hypothetical protein U9O98_01770, partial [Asgard group archaeon]|nr:hypothetical protein [Asgard group archaeon]
MNHNEKNINSQHVPQKITILLRVLRYFLLIFLMITIILFILMVSIFKTNPFYILFIISLSLTLFCFLIYILIDS